MLPLGCMTEFDSASGQRATGRPGDGRQCPGAGTGATNRYLEEFDCQPIASASIGQAHMARLPDGRQVVVKIQRPEIEDQIESDMALLAHLASLIDHGVSWARKYRLPQLMHQVRQTFLDNNYYQEKRNMELADKSGQLQPHCHSTYFDDYCTRRILVMEHVEGQETEPECQVAPGWAQSGT